MPGLPSGGPGGAYRIVAGKDGMRITDLRNTTPITPVNEAKLADFAAWLYMKDKWRAPGDFSIKTDPSSYEKAFQKWAWAQKRLSGLEKSSKNFGKEKKIRFRRLKELVFHNADEAGRDMAKFMP